MTSLLATPSLRLIGMLRIGIDGLILFMEPTSLGPGAKIDTSKFMKLKNLS